MKAEKTEKAAKPEKAGKSSKNAKAEKEEKKQKRKGKEKTAHKLLPATASTNGMEQAMQRISGKWKLPVLWSFRLGEPLRYSQIKLQIHGISDITLSQTLRELADSNMIVRESSTEASKFITYRLTKEGKGILPALAALAQWGETLQDEPG